MDDNVMQEATDGRFHDIQIEVTVAVGHARPTIKELLSLNEMTVLPLDRKVEEPVELYVNGRLIARGELEEMEGDQSGQLAVRLTEVISLPGETK